MVLPTWYQMNVAMNAAMNAVMNDEGLLPTA
jgi:hypothetical protein